MVCIFAAIVVFVFTRALMLLRSASAVATDEGQMNKTGITMNLVLFIGVFVIQTCGFFNIGLFG